MQKKKTTPNSQEPVGSESVASFPHDIASDDELPVEPETDTRTAPAGDKGSSSKDETYDRD